MSAATSAREFTIPTTELDAGGREFRFVVRPAWVRSALEGHEASAGTGDGSLVVRASKSGHDVVVNGTLEAELELPCARCLSPFTLPVSTTLQVLYVPRGNLKTPDGEYELSQEEADVLPFDGETVVLDDLVRDDLMLEVPMIPLCSETCAGMSSPPAPEGEAPEKGLDPRLLPLLSFRVKKES